MKKIGFIGLGIMGKPMALNLLNSGFDVSILITSKASGELGIAGANVCANLEALSAKSEVIITMLPDSPEVLEVVNQLVHSIKPGTLFIDMSSIAPAATKNIHDIFKKKGVEALDAPVSGGQVGAVAGSLSIMVGGSEMAFKNALPIFEAMGKNIVHIGESGAGQITKICNQMIVGITIQAVSEAITLAKSAGVNVEKVRDVLLGGFAQSKILDLHGKRMIEENFVPGFTVNLHNKDLGIALKTSQELGLTLPGTEMAASLMEKAIKKGNGHLDHSSLILNLQT
jgi:2-hydroxy-3-oxopropionate reductase